MTKSVLVVSAHNVSQAEIFFRAWDLRILTCGSYVGGYIRYAVPKSKWLVEKVQFWAGGVKKAAGVARK